MIKIQNGKKIITLEITAQTAWESGDKKRTYFEVPMSEKRKVVHTLYRIDAGTTRDKTMEVNGITYGYVIFADSDRKKQHILDGLQQLLETL